MTLLLSLLLAVPSSAQSKPVICRDAVAISSPAPSLKLFQGDTVDGISMPSGKDYAVTTKALIQQIENYYGPLKLKETTIGLKWDKAKQQLLGKLGKVKTPTEYVFLVAEFLHSFNDAHVSIELPSSLTWTLPIQFTYAKKEDQYVMNFINRELTQKMVREGSLPEYGAELVGINGMTVEQFRSKLHFYNSSGNDLTNKSIFARTLTKLRESRGLPLSVMDSSVWSFDFIEHKSDGSKVKKSVKLEYAKDGIGFIDYATVPADIKLAQNISLKSEAATVKPLRPRDIPLRDRLHTMIRKALGQESLDRLDSIGRTMDKFHKLLQAENISASHDFNMSTAESKGEGRRYGIGEREPSFKLPADFKEIKLPQILEKSLNGHQIFAGTFMKDGKRVGLLRIPSYSVDSIETLPLTLRFFLNKLEAESDYMILDQMDNPGGYVIYSDYLVKALAGKYDMQKHLQFRVKPTHSFMRNYLEIYEAIQKDASILPPAEREQLLQEVSEQFEKIHRAYRENAPLSEPISMVVVSKFYEAVQNKIFSTPQFKIASLMMKHTMKVDVTQEAHYTKPIIMLINQFDFSGGDATPASLQDYGRVILVGVRTAGAGGTVEEFSSRHLLAEFSYHLTTSLMYRPANIQHYVENNGIIQDVLYVVSKKEILNGQENVLSEIFETTTTFLENQEKQNK